MPEQSKIPQQKGKPVLITEKSRKERNFMISKRLIKNERPVFPKRAIITAGMPCIRILCSEKNMIEDSNGVVRGKLSFVPTDAGTYSEGFISIKNGEKYGYYNSLGDYKFGEYVAASNFANGKAAVSEKEGEWFFIDTLGKKISDTKYQEVKLNLDGSYLKNGVIIGGR